MAARYKFVAEFKENQMKSAIDAGITVCTSKLCAADSIQHAQVAQASIGQQAGDFFSGIFATNLWPERWFCGEWSSFHGWLYIVSDVVIWLSYFAIPIILGFFLFKRKVYDGRFKAIAVLFIAFILACGLTHLMDAAIFWWPAYRLSALLRFGTASISLFTVAALVKVVPSVLELKSQAYFEKLVAERTAALETVNKKLKEEVEERTRIAERLRGSNEELLAFSYSVSHDLRSPLRSIHGFSQALMEDFADSVNDEGKDYMKRICVASSRMGDLIDDLLKLSKLSRDQVVVEDVSLSDVAQDVIVAYIERHTSVKTSFEIEANLNVKADRKLLKIAMENLVDNAIKYSSRSERPMVKIGKLKNENTYYIQDNGVGFDMEYAGKLFRPFHRLHEGEFDGSGIGLATVKRIMQKHGGKIWVEGKVHEGATFYISF